MAHMKFLHFLRFAVNAQRNYTRFSVPLYTGSVASALVGNKAKCLKENHSSGIHIRKKCYQDLMYILKNSPRLSLPLVPHIRQDYGEIRNPESSRENGSSKSHKSKLVPLIALALFQSKKSDEEEEKKQESPLIMTIKRGILALQRGDLNKAEQMLHIALKMAQEGQNEQAETYIFDLLANLAYQREEYTKAENLFKEVLKRILSDGMAEDDNAVVEISLKLASVYASRGDLEKAVQGFHFCIATQEEKIKKYGESNLDEDTLLLWAMSMDWYARFLLSIKKYDLAKKHFVKAYEMSVRVNGLGHPQTAVLLNDIGSVCSLEKNYPEAIIYLEKAIDAARESQSPDIGSFYVNLGAVYLQQGLLADAERYCKEGLRLAKKMKNDEALEEAESCLSEINKIKGNSKK